MTLSTGWLLVMANRCSIRPIGWWGSWHGGGTNYHGISWPSQAKNFPLSLLLELSMMLKSFCTENSFVKSLPSGTFLWNGRERSVSTVPGCNRMQIIGSFFRANSTDMVFVTAHMWKENRNQIIEDPSSSRIAHSSQHITY